MFLMFSLSIGFKMKLSKIVVLAGLICATLVLAPTSAFAGSDKGNQSQNGNGKGKGNGGPATPTQVVTTQSR